MSKTPRDAGSVESPVTSNFPSITLLPSGDPQVILAFHGLMALRYKTIGRFCEVGMHNAAPKHDLSIKVFDLTSGSDDPFYTYNFGPAGSSPVEIIRFDAANADPSDVRFFEPINFSFGTAGQRRIVEDPLDFRQLSDFEGPEFYDRELIKNEGVFRPKLILRSGIFVTLVPSERNFRRQAPFDVIELGKIAEITAAGIYLQPNGLVSLRFAQEEVRLPLKSSGETLYLFLFDNSCPKQVCTFDPHSPIKEQRNDFFEYYKMFALPDDREEFELLLGSATGAAPVHSVTNPVSQAYERAARFLRKITLKESSNDAPCGPVRFGGGGG